VHDISCENDLVEHLRAKAVIADKGYDSGAFVQAVCATGATVVIPPRSNCKTKRRHSHALYRTRNLVERFFNRIKHFRRISTRYDKLADSYLVFASLACAFGPFVKIDPSLPLDRFIGGRSGLPPRRYARQPLTFCSLVRSL